MNYEPCSKRQNENYKGTPRERCIEPTSELHREIVTPESCSGCPVRKFAKVPTPCNQPEPPVLLPIIEEGWVECPFRYGSTKGPACSITKHQVTPGVCQRCDAETREHEAGTIDKIKNYFGAVRRWVAHGKPVRSDDRVVQIYEEYCKTCDRYDPDAHACKNCGCSVSTDSSPLGNKLKMATEVCPLGLWE